MVAKIFEIKRESKRRIDLFKDRCAKLASTRVQFYRHFSINQDHIVIRGVEQNSSLRQAIEPIHVAAVIIHGRVNYGTCQDFNPMKIAIDGVFRGFRYVEFHTTRPAAEIVIPRLQIRIVLRDEGVKIVVVTVHSMQDIEDETLPEVNYEIW